MSDSHLHIKKNKVCIFSSFSNSDNLSCSVRIYLKELKRFHERVILVTNKRKLSPGYYDSISELKVEIVLVENEGMDFGMWYKVLLSLNIKTIDRLSLVNDSCYLIKKLDSFFKWVEDDSADYLGITNSIEQSEHIQSYFLVIKKSAIQVVYDYFMKKKILYDRESVIKNYEIGLSQHILSKGLKIASMFDCKKYDEQRNITVFLAEKIVEDGCPIIKKKNIDNAFSKEDFAFITSIGYDFTLNHPKLIKKFSDLGIADIDSILAERKSKVVVDLSIWQIYYDELSRKSIGDRFIPYNNSNKVTIFFENEVIIDVYKNQNRWEDSDYVGVMSWRLKEKSNIDFATIEKTIKNNLGKDVFSILPDGFVNSNSPFSEFGFGNIKNITTLIDDDNLFPFKISGFNATDGKFKCFCNYFVCKPSIFKDYVENYLLVLYNWIEQNKNPLVLQELKVMVSHRNQMYPIHTFLLEGLFECYINYKKYNWLNIRYNETVINETVTPNIEGVRKKALNAS